MTTNDMPTNGPPTNGTGIGNENQQAQELKEALETLNKTTETLLTDQNNDEVRQNVILAAEKLILAAQDPRQQWWELVRHSTLMTAIHVFQEWGAFEEIPEEGSISFAELGEKINAEGGLIERFAGVLTSRGILLPIGTDRVAHTRSSRIFLRGNPAGEMYSLSWETTIVSDYHLLNYFDIYGRKEPQSMNHIPSTFARGCPEKSFFAYLQETPGVFHRFARGMKFMEIQAPATGLYDFTWLVEKAEREKTERKVFVDVGGGRGQAIMAIHDKFPGIPLDRCVLQDRAEVIKVVEAAGDEKIKEVQKVAIDFLVSQPVQGAMVYFIRRCLHSHSDTLATKILEILAQAMADDSKLLIMEDIVANPPHTRSTTFDMMMMKVGGKERPLHCWETVTRNAGLVITNVLQGTGQLGYLSVIECMKVPATLN